jgi:3-deoxy-D-manno-octulosonic-acid transferase
VRSAVPLVSALKARASQRKILLSTFTATGNRQARQIPGVDAVIFFPLDLFWIVRRALMKFDPALLVIIETEIWPNLLRQAYRRGVPTLLLSGRLSAKASARYTLCRSFLPACRPAFPPSACSRWKTPRASSISARTRKSIRGR